MNPGRSTQNDNVGFLARLRALLSSGPAMPAISVLFTAAAIWLLLRNIEFDEVIHDIVKMPAWPFVLAFGIMLIVALLRSLRLYVITRGIGGSFGASVETILIGYFFIMVFPLRLGELVRIGYLTRRTRMPLLSATTALGTERAMDLIGLAFIASAVLSDFVGRRIPDLPVPPWLLSVSAAGALGIGLAMGLFFKDRFAGGENSPEWARRFDELAKGLSSLGSIQSAATALGLSIAIWMSVALAMLIAFQAVDADPSFVDVAVIMLGTCFSIALPSTPGSVGTYHVGFVYASQLVGIVKAVSLPVAIVFHLVIQVPFLPLGAAVLLTGGRRALAKAPKEEIHTAQP